MSTGAPAGHGVRSRARPGACGLALLLLAPALVAAPAAADSSSFVGAALSPGREGSVAVWDGQVAYVLGGGAAAVARYDLGSDSAMPVAAELSDARHWASAVWDGASAYLFGGFNGAPLDTIARYQPATDTVTIMEARLPSARYGTSAVWDRQHAYIFGGASCCAELADILRYDPETDTLVTMGASLPEGRAGSSAVWDGSRAYILGDSQAILRYDPSSDALTTMDAMLPSTRKYAAAVWDGSVAYLFGGYDAGFALTDGIFRFDPVGDEVTTMAETLPAANAEMSVVWDGTDAYLIGGKGGSHDIVRYTPSTDVAGSMADPAPLLGGSRTSAVWSGEHAYVFDSGAVRRFTPATETMATMGAAMPSPRWDTSAVWAGDVAYIFGGRDGAEDFAEILRFNPANDTMTVMDAELTTARFATSAAWDGDYAYVFGGRSCVGDVCVYESQVLRYDPALDVVTPIAVLPTERGWTSAVWAADYGYVFGGVSEFTECHPILGCEVHNEGYDDILRYDPATDLVTKMNATLPGWACGTSAVWDGSDVFILGGGDWHSFACGGDGSPRVERYQPSDDVRTTMRGRLAAGLAHASAVWDGQAAYAFGGAYRSNEFVVRYETTPGGPQLVTSVPGQGQIALSWSPPSEDTHTSPISGYRVYRDEALVGELGDATSHTDSGLADSATHSYEVRAVNAGGEGAQSRRVQATTFPPVGAPTTPRTPSVVGGPGAGQLTLTWEAPASSGDTPVTAYKVYRAGYSGGTFRLVATLGDVLEYQDRGLPDGATRHYQVSAVNSIGEGNRTSAVSGKTFSRPGAPVSLSASAGPGAGDIRLEWTAPASDGGTPLTGYKVHRATDAAGPFELVATLGALLTYTDAGLPNGVARHYKVSALNIAGEGAQSPAATGTTFDIPGSPTGLAATAGPGVGDIQLTWQAPSSDGGTAITGYKVYRATSSGGTSTLLATPGSVLSYTDAGLPNGATRYYTVAASNLVGEGQQSNESSASAFDLPSAPQSLSATGGPAAGEIQLSWKAPASIGGTATTTYRVYRATDSGGTFGLLASLGDVRTYKDAGLPGGATRFYKVSATNLVGEGATSSEAGATTPTIVPATPPRNLATQAGPGAGQIKLTWQAPAQDGGAPVTAHALYRADASSGPYAKVATLGDVLTHADTGLPNGATRWYKLSALNIAGEGAPSDSASARTFDKPSAPRDLDGEAMLGLHVNNLHLGMPVKLTWTAPDDDGGTPVTGYKVTWSTDPDAANPQQVCNVGGGAVTCTHNGADPLKPNYYRVKASNLVGEGPASARTCALTHPWALSPLLVPPGGACQP